MWILWLVCQFEYYTKLLYSKNMDFAHYKYDFHSQLYYQENRFSRFHFSSFLTFSRSRAFWSKTCLNVYCSPHFSISFTFLIHLQSLLFTCFLSPFLLHPWTILLTAHNPFVHNVMLFICHSCLLPCLLFFFFLLPLFLFLLLFF